MRPICKRILPIVKKEFKQVVRDRRTLGALLFTPAFMLIMFGYAANFDVRNISLAVYDEDKSPDSRSFIDNFLNSGYFTLNYYLQNKAEVDGLLGEEQIQAALIIPNGFSSDLLSGNQASIQVIIDGANSNTATTISGYIEATIQNYSKKIIAERFLKIGRSDLSIPIDFRPRLWFNPELKSAKFLVPGLIGYILMITTVISTALSVVREKERGTMEQIIVSPIKPWELIIGKVIPYIFISLFAAAVIILVGFLLFDVSVKGSFLLLFIVTLIFITAGLGLGLLISTFAENQQTAFTFAVTVTMLPTFILSGFIFPIRNMPVVIQIVTYFVPAKYFIVALRAIILKGVGITAFWDQLLYLVIFMVLTVGIASLRMRKWKL